MPATINLLIVDDEPATRSLLSQIFARMGHSVRTAKDGFTALEEIREAMPDVLLSDLNMPGMSGFELLSVVRRRLPEIYVIATSGAYTGEDVPPGIAADAFYEKASGFLSLVNLMEKASGLQEISRPNDTDTPMWVSQTDFEFASLAYVTISCPECLRAFPQLVGDSKELIRKTVCGDCKTPIHYAVVEPLDPLTSQPYHAKLAEALVPANLLHEAEISLLKNCARL